MLDHWSLLVYTSEPVYRIALHTCIHITAVGNWNHGSSINSKEGSLYINFQSIHTSVASKSSIQGMYSWPRYDGTRIPTHSLSHQVTVVKTNKSDNNAGFTSKTNFLPFKNSMSHNIAKHKGYR